MHTAQMDSPEHPRCTTKPCGFVLEDLTLKVMLGEGEVRNEISARSGIIECSRSVHISEALRQAKY